MLLSANIANASSTNQTPIWGSSMRNTEGFEATMPPLTQSERITYWAHQFNVNPNDMADVLMCESRWKQSARGALDEIGIAQFRPATFKEFSKKYGWEMDIYNENDQLKLMSKMFSDGFQYLWTCWKK